MAIYSERAIAIAKIIERYVVEHPRAADTAEGIRSWWVPSERRSDSIEDVQMALDYLVECGRLSRSVLPDGAAIYSRTAPHDCCDQ